MRANPKVKLGACVDLVAGLAFKSQHFTDNVDDVALVKGENVSQGRVLWEISKRWPAAEWDRLGRFHLVAGDVVVAMDRPWVPAGLKWAVIRDGDPKALLVQRVARLRTKNNMDQEFLRYVIGGPDFEAYVKPITSGVNVPHISGRQILDFEFALPPLAVQRRVARVLSAYDDLIENNLRRIQILEQMASSLYREWYVEHRYPDHKRVPCVSSALGRVPANWEVVSLDEVCERVTDGSHFSPHSVRKGFPMASSKDMHDWGLNRDTCRQIGREDFDLLVRNGCKPEKNDVLITKDGNSYLKHIFVMPQNEEVVLLSSIAILRPNARINPHLLAATLRAPENKSRLKNFVTGAAIPRVILKDFKRFHITLPTLDVQERWALVAEPIAELCWTLIDQNSNLRRTRDLLLPRLLSGQITLTEAAA